MQVRPRLKGRHRRHLLLAGVVLAGVVCRMDARSAPPAPTLEVLARTFRDPPPDSRVMMRWWWFGPSVTDAELTRELRVMHDAGIGGVEIQPVYPVALEDRAAGLRIEPFLGDGFLAHLRHAAQTARDLGMRVDLTLGSGWPYGGPTVGIDDAASRLRIERVAIAPGSDRVALPPIGTGEVFLAAYLLAPADAAGAPIGPPITTARDGAVQVEPAGAPRVLLVAIASRTGQLVKRAAVGAEGFVLDHYDRGALDRYLSSVAQPLIRAFADLPPPTAVFCDSLEVYDSDWTGEVLAEFKRRRGYDLLPLVPALVSGRGDAADAVRHDWGQTLTELVNERFLVPLDAWARAQGTTLRAQVYGTPPAAPSSATLVALPEGEGAGWRELSSSRWSASGAHVAGVPVASSETWTWLHSPAFRATPLDVKAEADRHFLQGINQLVGHGFPYSAPGVAEPGWRFYAAAALNDHNPWWIVVPDVMRALQRSSWLLRQGEPVADVALVLPVDDGWASFEPGQVALIEALRKRIGTALIPSLLDAGFNFDVVDRFELERSGTVEGTSLRVGARRYSAVVLADVERIEPADLVLLDTFARAGGALIAAGRRPSVAPGYTARASDHDRVRRLTAGLFVGSAAPGQFVADSARVGAALAGRLMPDARADSAASDIGVVHRRLDGADVYFVANTANAPRHVSITFRVAQGAAEWWDPLSGGRQPLPVTQPHPASRAVLLDLPPYGSGFVVFGGGATAHPAKPPAAGAPGRQLALTGPWRVSFGQRDAPRTLDALESWTAREDTRYFSGVAQYEQTVDIDARTAGPGRAVVLDFGPGVPLPAGTPGHGMRAWLDGPVREAAVVYVNGTRAGSIWCPPYEVRLDGLLRPGRNTIRIDVANTAMNEMAGRALPDYRLLNLRYGVRFEPQDMEHVRPEPSGLLRAPRIVWPE